MRYLEGLMVKNEIVRNELQEFAEQQEMKLLKERQEMDKRRMEHFARKNHHLVSTYVMPGIYNSPFNPYPDPLEFTLMAAKPLMQQKRPKGTPFDPRCASYDLPEFEPLPPISAKPQGPFR